MSTQHPSPALSARSETLLAAFSREPGVTPDHVANLRAAIISSPVLMAELDKALEQGDLLALKPLQNANAGGQYHPQSRRRRFLLSTLAATLLAGITTACTATPNLAKETTVMNAPHNTPAAPEAQDFPAPQLTPEQMLNRLLDLIAQTQSIDELTHEYLLDFFGVKGGWKIDDSSYGFGERLTRNWASGWEIYRTVVSEKKMFSLSFSPVPIGSSPEMTEICAVDFDSFIERLKASGFLGEPYHAEHGRLFYYEISNGKLNVEVYPRGENNANAAHSCVKMVIVR